MTNWQYNYWYSLGNGTFLDSQYNTVLPLDTHNCGTSSDSLHRVFYLQQVSIRTKDCNSTIVRHGQKGQSTNIPNKVKPRMATRSRPCHGQEILGPWVPVRPIPCPSAWFPCWIQPVAYTIPLTQKPIASSPWRDPFRDLGQSWSTHGRYVATKWDHILQHAVLASFFSPSAGRRWLIVLSGQAAQHLHLLPIG